MEDVPRVIFGMDDTYLGQVFDGRQEIIDAARIRIDMVRRAKEMVRLHPEVGIIVLECTNMPPYAKAVQEAVGLPVFDITNLVKYVHDAVTAERYDGWF